jgi:hypothetical protein
MVRPGELEVHITMFDGSGIIIENGCSKQLWVITRYFR